MHYEIKEQDIWCEQFSSILFYSVDINQVPKTEAQFPVYLLIPYWSLVRGFGESHLWNNTQALGLLPHSSDHNSQLSSYFSLLNFWTLNNKLPTPILKSSIFFKFFNELSPLPLAVFLKRHLTISVCFIKTLNDLIAPRDEMYNFLPQSILSFMNWQHWFL